MKKIYYILFAILATLSFTGCKEKADIDHPIAGHTYAWFMDTEYGYEGAHATFHSKGNFTIHYYTHNIYQGDTSSTYSDMLWSVDGNNITVKNDNSSTLESVRGKVVYTGFYNPKDSTVILNDLVYKFLE